MLSFSNRLSSNSAFYLGLICGNSKERSQLRIPAYLLGGLSLSGSLGKNSPKIWNPSLKYLSSLKVVWKSRSGDSQKKIKAKKRIPKLFKDQIFILWVRKFLFFEYNSSKIKWMCLRRCVFFEYYTTNIIECIESVNITCIWSMFIKFGEL